MLTLGAARGAETAVPPVTVVLVSTSGAAPASVAVLPAIRTVATLRVASDIAASSAVLLISVGDGLLATTAGPVYVAAPAGSLTGRVRPAAPVYSLTFGVTGGVVVPVVRPGAADPAY
jgi:hypothetical protein